MFRSTVDGLSIRVSGNNDKRTGQAMAQGPKSGLRNVVLIWVIGLTLGIAAGAATAMLLMPAGGDPALEGPSLADRFRGS